MRSEKSSSVFCPHGPGGAVTGFTLVEMLIVLVVLGILVSLALPSFRDLTRSQAIKNASFDVFSSLVLARNEAVTRNATVTITPNGGSWASGWQITEAGGAVIRRQDSFASGVTVTGPASVIYNGMGRLIGATSAFGLVDGGGGFNTRCIRVDLSGRPVVNKGTCS